MLFLIHKKALAVMQRKVKAETDSKADRLEAKTSSKTTEPEIKRHKIKRHKMTTRSDLLKHKKKHVFSVVKWTKKALAQQTLYSKASDSVPDIEIAVQQSL